MKRVLKICAVTGLCLALAGGVLLAVGFALAGRESWEQAKDGGLSGQLLETVPEQEISNLSISLKAGELIIRQGETLKVSRYDGETSFDCYVEGDTLVIREKEDGLRGISLFGIHISKNGVVRQKRKVLLEVPADKSFSSAEWKVDAGRLEADSLTISGDFCAKVNAGSIQLGRLTSDGSVKVDVDAGNFKAEELYVVGETDLDVDAGNIQVGKFNGKSTEITCDVGSVELAGEILGPIRGDCSMGSISLRLSKIRERYHYSGNSDIGSVLIDGTKLGAYQNTAGTDAYPVEFSCSMGNIEVIEK